jgi:hypothetical protein
MMNIFACLGSLKRASFDMKTFANEMCRFICESIQADRKYTLMLSASIIRLFKDFQWYFGRLIIFR